MAGEHKGQQVTHACQPGISVPLCICCRWVVSSWTCVVTPRSAKARVPPSLPARPSRRMYGQRPPCGWIVKVREAVTSGRRVSSGCELRAWWLTGSFAASGTLITDQNRLQISSPAYVCHLIRAAVQSMRQASPTPAARQQAGAAQPLSPQEVSSKQRLQEEGADNFPGFWRPPAAGSPSATSEPAALRRRSSRKRANPVQIVVDKQEQRRQPQQQWAQAQPVEDSVEGTPTQGRKRKVCGSVGPHPWLPVHGARHQWLLETCYAGCVHCQLMLLPALVALAQVRFCVPEEQEAQPTPAAVPQEQQPTPLVIAPPVLPSGRAGSSSGRPSTPAKPAPLRMPQPPAFSRFG